VEYHSNDIQLPIARSKHSPFITTGRQEEEREDMLSTASSMLFFLVNSFLCYLHQSEMPMDQVQMQEGI
jgi:hypothetical protein